MSKIPAEFSVARKSLVKLEVRTNLGFEQLINRGLGVYTSSRVSIPEPGAAQGGASFVDFNGKSQSAEFEEGVDPGEASSYDQSIQDGLGFWRHVFTYFQILEYLVKS